MTEQKQIWLCAFIDDDSGEKWEFEVASRTPMSQANAEVSGIKSLASTRPGARIRCTHSRFLREA